MMTLTAYAARRGVSPKAVSKAVAAGRLVESAPGRTGSVVRDEHGQPKIGDPELADREWEANTRQRAPVRPVPDSRQGTPSPQQSGDEKLVVDAGASPAPGTTTDPGAPPQAPDHGRARGGAIDPTPNGSSTVPDFNTSRALRAAAAARREAHLADLAELELAERRGELVDAGQRDAAEFARISMAKTRLLGVPSMVAQDAPDLAARIVPLIDRRIREAIEELELSIDGRNA